MDDRDPYPACFGPLPPDLGMPPPPKPARKTPKQSPQATVHQFWQQFSTKHPGKVFAVLPSNPLARRKRAAAKTYSGIHVAKSYDEARAECIRDVDRIIRECRRTNQKYRDLHFDIEWDLKSHQRSCLDGLRKSGIEMKPKGVKRVTDIFENPQFYINGPTAGDVRQGRDGDCYLMAALCGLGNMKGLIDRVCVKHDLQVGVYGFVFHRDGEWQQTIIDDKLYLRAPDYDEALDERVVWDDITRINSEEEYRKAHQTGSRALYFAQCSEENETWLPLLEKAYAKAHGDFASIDGGFTGEAVEDLTGGVTTEIYSSDVLDKEAFWKDELMQVNKDFLFGCATGFYSNWLDTTGRQLDRERQGIDEHHAYSIMEAREVKGKRLLKVRNPWGRKEWEGKWSDGSSEWDAEWLQLLDHKFGNDGIFWITFEDLLNKYQHFDRTRIFGNEWTISQTWVGLDVGWSPEYHQTRFLLEVKEKGPVVIVLSQLDDSYFDGLDGCYSFDLQFRLEEAKERADPDDYIVRSNGAYAMARSVSTDIELDAGTYVVFIKITATRDPDKQPIEEVLAEYVEKKREKLIQMATSYDLSHAKGVYVESKQEKEERKSREEAFRKKEKERVKRKMRERAEKHWEKEKKRHDREKERVTRKKKKGGPEQKSRKGSGSLDAQPPASTGVGETSEDKREVEKDGAVKPPQPIKIQSFSGETINTGSSPIDSGVVPTEPAPTQELTKDNDTTTEAKGVVQSLDEVLKTADDATGAHPTDASTVEPITETERPQTPIIQVNGENAVTDVKPLPNLPPLSTPEHVQAAPPSEPSTQRPNGVPAQRDNAPPGHLTRQNTFSSTFAPGSFDAHNDKGFDADETGSMDSYPSFDWNSELDMPSEYGSSSSSSSDSDEDSDLDNNQEDFGDGAAGQDRPTSSHSITSSISSDGNIMYKPHPKLPSRSGRNRRILIRDDPTGLPPPEAQDAGKAGDEPWNAVCVVGLRVYSKSEVGLKVLWGNEEEEERRQKRKIKRKAAKERKRFGGKHGEEVSKDDGQGKPNNRLNEDADLMSPQFKLDPDDQGKGLANSPTS